MTTIQKPEEEREAELNETAWYEDRSEEETEQGQEKQTFKELLQASEVKRKAGEVKREAAKAKALLKRAKQKCEMLTNKKELLEANTEEFAGRK